MLVAFSLFCSPAAQADPVLKAGSPADTSGGFCAPTHIVPSYSQQVSGTEPRVNDVFYISIRMDLSLITFDCASEFYSVQADLPPGVSPAIGGSATMICRRWGFNNAGQQVNDQRSQANCPTSVTADGNGVFSMRPKSSPVLPDVGGGAGSYWFAGIRSPQESQSYDHVQLLVPVKSTVTMTNQPIGFLVCATGTSCENVSVGLTVSTGPVNADPPQISLPGSAQTTAVGARVPFTINDNTTGSSYYIKLDTSTNPAFPPATAAGRPCGLTDPVAYQNSATSSPFTGSSTFEAQFGDLQTGGTTCYLTPATTYNFKVCTSDPATAFPFTDFAGCRTTQFTTGAVNVTLEMPGSPPFSITPTAKVKVLAGHPAGTVKVKAKPKTSGTFTDVTSATAVSQATSDSPVANQTFTTALDYWRNYLVQACFIAGAHQPCSTPIDYVTGSAETLNATDVTATTASLSGRASSPNPNLEMNLLLSTSNPGTADPRQVMTKMASGFVPGNGTASPNAVTFGAVSGLAPETQYFWTACFDYTSYSPTNEDCGEVKAFTTAAAPGFCETNPTDPGCTPDPCDDNPGDPSCSPDPCDANPADPACTSDPCDDSPRPASCEPQAKPVLALGKAKTVKVKRGKKGQAKVTIGNASNSTATAARLCLKVSRKLKSRLKLPGCKSLGSIASGSSKTVTVTVKPPGKAKPGPVKVGLTLTWDGGSASGSVKVRITK